MDADTFLESWSNPNNPAAYSGQNIVAKHIPLVTKENAATQLLPSTTTYQKYRTAKPPKQYNPYFVRKIRKLFQSDLIFMRNPISMVRKNEGYQYILIVQDTFTRKVWAMPLKNKNASTVLVGLEKIFDRLMPISNNARLVVDRGTEYINAVVARMLKRHNIEITHPSNGHAPHIERANLSLQRILYQQMNEKSSERWIDFLQNALTIMNTRHHRIIKMSPNEAELSENANKINEAMAVYRHKAFRKEQTKSHRKKAPKFKEGDHVRILKIKGVYARGYDRTFTTKVYVVRKVLDHLPITMYTLNQWGKDEPLEGNFYPEELSIVKGSIFKVAKVLIHRQRRNGVLHSFVQWEGYPESYNSWIPSRNILK